MSDTWNCSKSEHLTHKIWRKKYPSKSSLLYVKKHHQLQSCSSQLFVASGQFIFLLTWKIIELLIYTSLWIQTHYVLPFYDLCVVAKTNRCMRVGTQMKMSVSPSGFKLSSIFDTNVYQRCHHTNQDVDLTLRLIHTSETRHQDIWTLLLEAATWQGQSTASWCSAITSDFPGADSHPNYFTLTASNCPSVS